MYKRLGKRMIDLVVSSIGFVALCPLFLVLLVGGAIVHSGSPFFFQFRPGRNGVIFRILKFKTMDEKCNSDGNLLPDLERITWFGHILRKTSLDELPQLLNVIRGDMSLIGPRPLLPQYLSLYTVEQSRRHLVRPGITGLAQVAGRNRAMFSERLKNDVYYVDNLSLGLDIKIVWLTMKAILMDSSSVINGQTVDDVDDVGLSKNLSSNNFKK